MGQLGNHLEEICSANPRGPGVGDVRRLVRLVTMSVNAAQAVGTQGRDTMSAGMEQDPRIGGAQAVAEEPPS